MNFYRVLVNSIIFSILISCSTMNIGGRPLPIYKGVDPEAQKYEDAWLELANGKGIKFDKTVTIGFKDIGRNYVVGACNYGLWFREIDLDSKYWSYFSEIGKMVLVWHESTHCYCNREHDYSKNKEYGEDGDKARKDLSKSDGFYSDKCPKSIMFPEIVNDLCFEMHQGEYISEMFQRCEPY